ncbi:Protein CBG14642 [Caenorhabditis briggsae]|uniref:Protein CBG14642 n=1 Tax=Caenorhabditis briggsae TaxID=6238 RepID=A8XKC6_CAEBR|nr:Protein CBG14642 [Caenorhabditis briggsae]CAP33100.2 Protein CBG14642 [Caenorhabditis briggsae]
MPQGILHTPNETVFHLKQYFYVLPSEVLVDEQYGRDLDENLLNQKKGLEESVITQECSSVTENCYVVVDRKVETELGQMVERHMFVKGFEDESDTIVRLIPQGDRTFEFSDTRMWKIDHLSIRAQYIAALISAPFIVSALSLVDSDNDGKAILEIGLGGGSLDMFLHSLNPKVAHPSKIIILQRFFQLNITAVELDPTVVSMAQKWFNVVNDGTRRTINADGLEFVKRAGRNQEKYDVVFLDACDSSKSIPCPSKLFRTPEMYSSFSSIVKTTGALVVNILSQEEDGPEVDQIIEDLSQHFGSCLKVSITDEVNIIAICTKQAISDSTSNTDFLRRRANAVTMRLGLQDVLKTIKMN